MKLYECPRNVWVRLADTDIVAWFEKIDGMYSVCMVDGQLTHIHACTEVEQLTTPPKQAPQ